MSKNFTESREQYVIMVASGQCLNSHGPYRAKILTILRDTHLSAVVCYISILRMLLREYQQVHRVFLVLVLWIWSGSQDILLKRFVQNIVDYLALYILFQGGVHHKDISHLWTLNPIRLITTKLSQHPIFYQDDYLAGPIITVATDVVNISRVGNILSLFIICPLKMTEKIKWPQFCIFSGVL